jgi:hypothetical protein
MGLFNVTMVAIVVVIRIKECIVVVHIIVKGLSVSIEKNKTRIRLLASGKEQHAILDFVGHGKRSGVKSVDHSAAVKTEEIVAPLSIPRGTKSNGTNGTWGHGVVMWLMRLYILTELVFTVTIMVDRLTRHNGTRAEGGGDPSGWRKGIEPKYFPTGQLDNHSWRDSRERD